MLRRIPSLGCLTQLLLSPSHGLTRLLVSQLASHFYFFFSSSPCSAGSFTVDRISFCRICHRQLDLSHRLPDLSHRLPDLSHRLPDLSPSTGSVSPSIAGMPVVCRPAQLPTTGMPVVCQSTQLPTAGVLVVCLSHGFLSLTGGVRRFSVCFAQLPDHLFFCYFPMAFIYSSMKPQ